MSEVAKSPRAVSDIQSDYQNLCLKAGHIQYQIFALSKDLELVNSSLRDLNLEAAEIAKVESKPEEAPVVEELPVSGAV